MNQLRIGLRDDCRNLQPGDELTGAAGWECSQPPKEVEVRLLWFTRGKGTQDVTVVNTQRFEQPLAAEARPFHFVLPPAPYSFSGKLISLIWAVEVVIPKTDASAKVEFSVGPAGQEVRLDAVP